MSRGGGHTEGAGSWVYGCTVWSPQAEQALQGWGKAGRHWRYFKSPEEGLVVSYGLSLSLEVCVLEARLLCGSLGDDGRRLGHWCPFLMTGPSKGYGFFL